MLLLPRLINFLLKKYRSYMFHAIFGIVLATTVPIIPLDYGDTAAAVVGAVCVFWDSCRIFYG